MKSKIQKILFYIILIQAYLRGMRDRKKVSDMKVNLKIEQPREDYENPEQDERSSDENFRDGRLQGLEAKSETEKIVHLSRINTIEGELPEEGQDIEENNIQINIPKELKEIGISTEPVTLNIEKELASPSLLASARSNAEIDIQTEMPIREEAIKLEFTSYPVESINAIIKVPESKDPLFKKRSLVIQTEIEEDINLLHNKEEAKFLQKYCETEPEKSEENSDTKRLSLGKDKSDEMPDNSLDMILEKELKAQSTPRSIFDRNSFQLFALKKFGEGGENLTKMLSVREKVILYRERTQKKYIKKMYKTKQISPRAYISKRRELERWVSQEREETKRDRSTMIDSWKKTADMIEEAHQNALQIKKLFKSNALSFNTDSLSVTSQELDQSKQNTFDLNELQVPDNEPSRQRRDPASSGNSDFDNLPEEVSLIEHHPVTPSEPNDPDPTQAIYIQEENSPTLTTKHISPEPQGVGQPQKIPDILNSDSKTSFDEEIIQEDKKEDAPIDWQITLQNTKSEKEKVLHNPKPEKEEIRPFEENKLEERYFANDKDSMGEEITAHIYQNIMQNILSNLFPTRSFSGESLLEERMAVEHLKFLQSLAMSKHAGLQTDLYHINDYLDEIFVEVLTTQRPLFLSDVNQPIQKDPIDILTKLQSPDSDQRLQLMQQMMYQQPHELSPILQLDTYLEVEKKKEIEKQGGSSLPEEEEKSASQSQQLVDECEHIHNKAIFDAINEALNMIRPYGMNGLPMPWSMLPRILFTKVGEANIIIRNIKNMVLDWASFEVGTLPKSEFVINNCFDEEFFSEVREKKLINLLAQEVIDSEEQWTHYEMEEAEVKIDIADMIMEHLVTETATLFLSLDQQRHSFY